MEHGYMDDPEQEIDAWSLLSRPPPDVTQRFSLESEAETIVTMPEFDWGG